MYNEHDVWLGDDGGDESNSQPGDEERDDGDGDGVEYDMNGRVRQRDNEKRYCRQLSYVTR